MQAGNSNQNLQRPDLIRMLEAEGTREEELFLQAGALKRQTLGDGVYLRGLIEISNRCIKNCYYCGIRRSNEGVLRYDLEDAEILEAADFAHSHRFGSVVLQGGEGTSTAHIRRIEQLVRQIKQRSNNALGITLSLGEQSRETYRRWFEAGAHRYLLRIETSNPALYARIHPNDPLHSHAARLQCIEWLQQCGYQTGTGVMIGLPFQTTGDLADDLLFLRSQEIDMVGMGPYLEHPDTPLYAHRECLLSKPERLRLSLRMVAVLRLLMPEINIAATTALQAIRPDGREKALEIGANIVMPNITPTRNREKYQLYENKPGLYEGAEESMRALESSIMLSGNRIIYDAWGDSLHFRQRQNGDSPHSASFADLRSEAFP